MRYSEDAYSLLMSLNGDVVLRIIVVFVMGRVQVCAGRLALILKVVMTITLNTWKTFIDERRISNTVYLKVLF